jgi:uncharacterized membrane protein
LAQLESPRGDPSSRSSAPAPVPPAPAEGVPARSGLERQVAPGSSHRRRPARERRPSAVTIVAVTYLLLSVAWLALTIQALVGAQILLPPTGGLLDVAALRRDLDLLGAIVAVRQAAVGVTAFVAGVALLRMHPRGWLLGMVAAVIVLAVQLVSWYDSTPNYTLMAITVVVVLLMNQAEVRDAFTEAATG